MPILGTLFRSRDSSKQETELVVIVTPYMVRPTARQELARPLDGLAIRPIARRTSSATSTASTAAAAGCRVGDLKGDYGFIVE